MSKVVKSQHRSFDNMVERIARIVLISVICAAFFATTIHILEPNSHVINLIVPPVALTYFCFAYWLLQTKRVNAKRILRFSYVGALICVATPVWFFSISSYLNADIRLVDALPPVIPLVIPLVVTLILIIRPRFTLRFSLLSWGIFALPIALYFILHPTEVFTPRGLDFIVLLGPVSAITFTLIPLFQHAQKTLRDLNEEQIVLQRLSETDPLTQCLNRRAGESLLELAISHSTNVSGAILFDIDNFKQVNDLYGHKMGDYVLVEVVNCCRKLIKSENQLIRWGGEEFLLLVEQVDLAGLESIAERLKTAIETLELSDVGRVTASFGISQISPLDTSTSLFHRIDKAMYMAKDKGRNQIVTLEGVA